MSGDRCKRRKNDADCHDWDVSCTFFLLTISDCSCRSKNSYPTTNSAVCTSVRPFPPRARPDFTYRVFAYLSSRSSPSVLRWTVSSLLHPPGRSLYTRVLILMDADSMDSCSVTRGGGLINYFIQIRFLAHCCQTDEVDVTRTLPCTGTATTCESKDISLFQMQSTCCLL